MGDVLALLAAAFGCLVVIVVRTVQADTRTEGTTDLDRGGRLLVATAVLAVVTAVALFLMRLFGG